MFANRSSKLFEHVRKSSLWDSETPTVIRRNEESKIVPRKTEETVKRGITEES